jgi:hypothetical protein
MSWTPSDVIDVAIAAGAIITSLVTAIIAALKGSAAQAQNIAQQSAMDAMSSRLDLHGQQINTLSTNQLPTSLLPAAMQTYPMPVPPPPTPPQPQAAPLPLQMLPPPAPSSSNVTYAGGPQ